MTPPRPDIQSVRSILFVCMGNICRSPLAQGVLEHLADKRGVRSHLTIESCGTGAWHIGEPPDPRTIAVAQRNGIVLRSRARQLNPASDFQRFDLLLAMDTQNLDGILRAGGPAHKAILFRTFDPQQAKAQPDTENAAAGGRNLDVPDPYHGGPSGFEDGFTMVHRTAMALLDGIFPPALVSPT